MRRIFSFILGMLITASSFAQIASPFRAANSRPVWMGEQQSYFNAASEKNVNVFVTRAFGPDMGDVVMFDISSGENFETNIMFYDVPKLLGALNVCAEALSEVSTLSRRAKNALIEGMDTIFPRAGLFWFDHDTLVGSFNNVLRPDIKIENGEAKLIITGKAVCRVKFNETMNDPEFAGDANVTTEYSLVFSSPNEVNELAACITSSVSAKNRIPTQMIPQHAFPRVFDRNFERSDFNGFMRRFNPTWDPTIRPFRPINMQMRIRNFNNTQNGKTEESN